MGVGGLGRGSERIRRGWGSGRGAGGPGRAGGIRDLKRG